MVPDPTFLGTVEDVTGPRVSVKLSDTTAHGLLFVNGEGYRVGQVGSFVRIPVGYANLYGVVAQVGAGAAPTSKETRNTEEGHVEPSSSGSRWLRVELVGEGRRGESFERGISQYPSIGDSVHVVTESDLRSVYSPGSGEAHVIIGRVASSESIPAYIELNRLVSRHSAIVGSTGSGKSTAVAGLLSAIADNTRFPAARVILLDLHGEYANAFRQRGRVFRINADSQNGERDLFIPFWALTSEELVAVTMGTISSTLSGPMLDRIAALKRSSKPGGVDHGIPSQDVTVDTPLPFCVQQLWYDSHCLQYATHSVSGNQNQTVSTRAWMPDPETGLEQFGDAMAVVRPAFRPVKDHKDDPDKVYKSAFADAPKTHLESLEVKLRDPRLKFLFSPGKWTAQPDGSTEADLDALLQEWIGGDAPISIFDLSGIPTTILDDLVGALLRILFDSSFWGRREPEGTRRRPLLLVLEEAHLYLGEQSKSRAAPAAKRIAKEGRKYGVGLMLVSQRPSEIDSTILSQCGTMIALRLTNERDRGQIRCCSADNLEGLFSMLPILRTGEALIVGEAVSMPVRALFNQPPLEFRPDSDDPLVVVPRGAEGKRIRPGGWTEEIETESYANVVKAWRRQDISPAEPSTPGTT